MRKPTIGYTLENAVRPDKWDGHLNTIERLRCDGLIEVCYEVNGVDVWGMERDIENNTVHSDNLEEHNDFDVVGDWSDTLMPATQCGHVTPVKASTKFRKQNLCQPIGCTGGN